VGVWEGGRPDDVWWRGPDRGKRTPSRRGGVRVPQIVDVASPFFRDLRVIQECAWKDSNLRHPV
jgi:hypothetical protein